DDALSRRLRCISDRRQMAARHLRVAAGFLLFMQRLSAFTVDPISRGERPRWLPQGALRPVRRRYTHGARKIYRAVQGLYSIRSKSRAAQRPSAPLAGTSP